MRDWRDRSPETEDLVRVIEGTIKTTARLTRRTGLGLHAYPSQTDVKSITAELRGCKIKQEARA